MTEIAREARLLQTFVRLTDTLVADYDLVDLMQVLVDACQENFDASDASILLADGAGSLEIVASTDESSSFATMMQLAAESGPCAQSFASGAVVTVADVLDLPTGWDAFGASARSLGIHAMHVYPMRLRDTTVGTLGLVRSDTGILNEQDAAAAQAFADVATVGILHERALRESNLLSEQLQSALTRRVVIEQAKGVVSYSNQVSVEEAWQLMRAYARAHQLPISRVAAALVDLTLTWNGPVR